MRRPLSSAALTLLLGIARSHAAPFVYVADQGGHAVRVFDGANGQARGKIAIDGPAIGVAVSRAADRVYVANDTGLVIVDACRQKVLQSITIGGGQANVAVTPDGSRVYVTNVFANTVFIIEADRVVGSVAAGGNPFGIAIDSSGSHGYVANQCSDAQCVRRGSVTVFNVSDNAVVATIPVGHEPRGLALRADDRKLYVANRDDNSVSVIDTVSNAVIATIHLGPPGVGRPESVAANPRSDAAYVTDPTGFVRVLDTAVDRRVRTIRVGRKPRGVAVTPDGRRVFVLNECREDCTGGGSVSVIDATSRRVVRTVDVGTGPFALFGFGRFIAPPCGADADCDDGDPCTIDSCNPSAGCVHTIAEGPTCTLTNRCARKGFRDCGCLR